MGRVYGFWEGKQYRKDQEKAAQEEQMKSMRMQGNSMPALSQQMFQTYGYRPSPSPITTANQPLSTRDWYRNLVGMLLKARI